MKPCAFSAIDGETRPRDFHAEVEVYQIVLLGQFPMWESVFRQFRFHAAHFHYHIVLRTVAFRYDVVWDIGDSAEQGGEFLLCPVHGFLKGFVRIFQSGYFCFDGFGFFFLFLFHQRTDLCGQFFAFRQIDV